MDCTICHQTCCECKPIPVIPATPSDFCDDVRACENQQLIYNALTGDLSITEGNGTTVLNTVTITTPLSVTDTQSVDLTFIGNNLSADVFVSAVAGNTLVLQPDGLYVASGGGEATTVSDTTTVDLTLTGVDITADVIISPNAGNILIDDGSGLYVPTSLPTVSDTTTVDLTLAGINISADVIISPNAGNSLINAGNGLFVSTIIGESTTVADTSTIDLTMTGYQITADVLIDPAPDNIIQIAGGGLYSSPCTIGGSLTNGTTIVNVSGVDTLGCLCTITSGLVGQVLTQTALGVEWQTPSAGTNFTISDGTNSEVINSGDTLTFQDGIGINATVSATDIVTLNINETTEYFSGLGAGNTVTLAVIPAGGLKVYRNGARQFPGPGFDYTVAGNIITFSVLFVGSEQVICDYYI